MGSLSPTSLLKIKLRENLLYIQLQATSLRNSSLHRGQDRKRPLVTRVQGDSYRANIFPRPEVDFISAPLRGLNSQCLNLVSYIHHIKSLQMEREKLRREEEVVIMI